MQIQCQRPGPQFIRPLCMILVQPGQAAKISPHHVNSFKETNKAASPMVALEAVISRQRQTTAILVPPGMSSAIGPPTFPIRPTRPFPSAAAVIAPNPMLACNYLPNLDKLSSTPIARLHASTTAQSFTTGILSFANFLPTYRTSICC